MDVIKEGAYCTAIGCDRRSRDGGYFPVADKKRCSQWLRKIRRGGGWVPTKDSYVCGEHFLLSDFTFNKSGKKVLTNDAVPQLVPIPSSSPSAELRRKKAITDRSERTRRRQLQPNQESVLRSSNRKSRTTSNTDVLQDYSNQINKDDDVSPTTLSNPYDLSVVTCIINVKDECIEYMQVKQDLGIPDCPANTPSHPIKFPKFPSQEIELIEWIREHENPDELYRWKQEQKVLDLEKANKELEAKVKEAEVLKNNLQKFYNSEQIELLCTAKNESGKWKKSQWSDASILNGIKLKFKCGLTGYQQHVEEGQPLPSVRCIQERTENFKCTPGIDQGTLEILKRRLATVECEADKDMILVNDEMSLAKGKQYDSSTGNIVGDCTLPMHSGVGSKGMAWMVAGLRKRVKQPVCYHITPNDVNGTAIRLVNEDLIRNIEKSTGGKILAYVTDMAGCNVGLWKDYGINANREGDVIFETEHPADKDRKLVIMPDTPHLGKNMKASLANNKEFLLSDSLVKKYKLKSNLVQFSHIEILAAEEKYDELLLAPKLQKAVLKPNTFQQMRVQNSTYVVNDSTSAALLFLAEQHNNEGYETTAWFCKKFNNWWKFMTSCSPKTALSLKFPEKYAQATAELKEFMEIIRGTFVKGGWKPWQKGILIATAAFLSLSDKLLNNPNYKFVLGCHFGSNCVENLFSLARMRFRTPNVLQWKNFLKAVILSQYARSISSSSYEQENTEYFCSSLNLDFLRKASCTPTENKSEISLPPDWSSELKPLSCKNQNALFHVAGYLLDSIMGNKSAQGDTKTCAQTCSLPRHFPFIHFTPTLAKLIPYDLSTPVRISKGSAKTTALKNAIQFMHNGTLDMCLLKRVSDFINFAKTCYFINVPALMHLSSVLLQLKVKPSNVWSILKSIHHPSIATAVCAKVLMARTRECLVYLENLDMKLLDFFLRLDRMHISSETELMKALVCLKNFNTKKNRVVRIQATRLLRFMAIKKEELPHCAPLLAKLLRPQWIKAVLIAINSGESSNLPKGFQTGCRTFTARRKKKVFSNAVLAKQALNVGVLEQTNRTVEAAALQLSKLGLSNMKDSSTCILVVGKNSHEIQACPTLLRACSGHLWKMLNGENGQRLVLRYSNTNAIINFVSFVSTGSLNMSLLKTLGSLVDFWMVNCQLRMPLAMQLSFDLLEQQINPENVWYVLRRTVYNSELSYVCDKILTEKTEECLQHMGNDVCQTSIGYFLSLKEMNIDSEVTLLQAVVKVQFNNDGHKKTVMRTLVNKLRFMTLTEIELDSIMPILKECLTPTEVEDVCCAVESGDSSKLPDRFNTLCNRRKPSSHRACKQSSDPDSKFRAEKTCGISEQQVISKSLGVKLQSGDQQPKKSSPSLKQKKQHSKSDSPAEEILNIVIKSESGSDKRLLAKTQKFVVADNIKKEEAEETKAANKLITDQDWDVEITDQIICVKKKQFQVKEEPKEQEQTSRAIKREAFDTQQETEVPAKKKRLSECSTDHNVQHESSEEHEWEFIETNGAMQVRRKHRIPREDERQPQKQIKIEPLEKTSSRLKEEISPRPVIQATSLVHFELLQDSFQTTKSAHHVQSEAEKIIMNVEVLKDLQLLGVELSARTEDTKLLNKYKKSSGSNEMYEEVLEVSVFSSELGLVFKSSVQGQRAYNSRLVINANNMPVIPQGSKLRVKVTALKGASYRTVSKIAFKGADAVLGKASVQHKALENGEWLPVNHDDFCPISRLFLKVQA